MTRGMEILIAEYNDSKRNRDSAIKQQDKLGVEMWSTSMLYWLGEVQKSMKKNNIPFDKIKQYLI